MLASAKEPLGVGIRLVGPCSFGWVRKGWDVKVKDTEGTYGRLLLRRLEGRIIIAALTLTLTVKREHLWHGHF